MKTFKVTIEQGAIVECYRVQAETPFDAECSAFWRFGNEYPSASEYAHVTKVEEVA